LEKVCNDQWNLKQDAGRSIKEGENEAKQNFPKYTKQIEMYYSHHREMIKSTFNESVDLLKYLKSKKYLCYVLSNWSSETFTGMIDDYPFLKLFDGMIISGDEKLVKPQKEIYELAISRFNLIPNNTVFIDDKFENIQAAKELNFKTIHLENPIKIKELIKIYL